MTTAQNTCSYRITHTLTRDLTTLGDHRAYPCLKIALVQFVRNFNICQQSESNKVTINNKPLHCGREHMSGTHTGEEIYYETIEKRPATTTSLNAQVSRQTITLSTYRRLEPIQMHMHIFTRFKKTNSHSIQQSSTVL